jgi:probable rRNA maturation factor
MISFHTEELAFQLPRKLQHKQWLKAVAAEEGKKVGELNYVFCSDEYLLKINQDYLQHDTLTDIVTFDNSDNPNVIEGDIFISYERVVENGEKLKTTDSELQRVMVHGLLHLCGYKDKAKADKSLMTEKEDYYLAKRN